MLLFAMIIGTFASKAQDLNFTIDIADPSAANVAIGYSPFDPAVTLQAGSNQVSGANGQQVFVTPQNGAQLEVTCDKTTVNYSQSMGSSFYIITIVDGMTVTIAKEGEGGPTTISTYFYINNDGTALLTTGGETKEISSGNYDVSTAEPATIAPKEGWVISEANQYFTKEFTQNSDGTISFIPDGNCYISLTTKQQGIDFNVDINVKDNVWIGAFTAENEELGGVVLEGYQSPFTGTAPLGTGVVAFWPVEGGQINGVKRIQADGTETVINVIDGASYGGWRSNLTEGDTFVVDAVGPEVELLFMGLDDSYDKLDPSLFVVTGANGPIALTPTEEGNATAYVHAGDIINVSLGRGYELSWVTAYNCNPIKNNGPVQTYMVTKGGTITLSGKAMTDIAVNIDNTAAVSILTQNGNGAALELTNGENRLTSVVNPLRIEAKEGFEILSVTLDGKAVEEINGYYIVELLTGMTLDITSRKLPEAFPVTITTIGGDLDNLVVRKENGDVADLSQILTATQGSYITIAPALGYMIESLTDAQGNTYSVNEDTDVWTVWFTETSSMISVTFKQQPEGKAFVGFRADEYVSAILFYEDGTRRTDVPSLKNGRTIEVNVGDQVEIYTWGNKVDFGTVTVNGQALEIPEGATELDWVKIDGRTVIDVTTVPHEVLVSVSGNEAIETTIGTGATIGTVYINEIGQRSADLKAGSTFYAIPVPQKGFKFDHFEYDWRTLDGDLKDNLQYDGVEDGKYLFTIPEGAAFVYLKGYFVLDNDNPAYMVEGNTIYEDVEDALEKRLYGLVQIDNGTLTGTQNVFAYEGEGVDLLFFQNIDDFPADEYYCYSFCLYNKPEVLIPNHYIVNPADVRDNYIISIGAIFLKRGESGLNGIEAGKGLNYDAATYTVTSDSPVRVYTISGQLVKEFPAGEGSIESLGAGVYVIANATEFVKIVK